MKHRGVVGTALAGLVLAGALGAQDAPDGRMVPALETLAKAASVSTDELLGAIRTLADLNAPTSSGASLLLDRANIRFEPDPEVRCAALAALVKCCPERDLQNRMVALRVVRAAGAATEPDPKVRTAALTTLSWFQSSEARARILESAQEAGEPEASVRQVARAILAKMR